MKYIVVKADNLSDLIEIVNMKIKQCYKPQGGIYIVKEGTSQKYYQAMIDTF